MRQFHDMQLQIQQVIGALASQVDELSRSLRHDFAVLDSRVARNEEEIELLFNLMQSRTCQPDVPSTSAAVVRPRDTFCEESRPVLKKFTVPQIAIVKMESYGSSSAASSVYASVEAL